MLNKKRVCNDSVIPAKRIKKPPSTALKPFWNGVTATLSKKCIFPAEADFLSTQDSWFTLNVKTGFPEVSSQKISSMLYMPSVINKKETGEKEAAAKSIKIRLFPNKKQKQTLNQWFGTARWTYNRVVDSIRNGCARNKKELRAKCVNNDLWKDDKFKWVTKTPYDIRDEAMNDVLKAYKTSIAAKRINFVVNFKSKKAKSDSIALLAKHWKSSGLFHPTFWGKTPLRSAEPLPEKLNYDCRIQRTNLGCFYLCIPQPLEHRSENQTPVQPSVIALDPGVRTFQTGYSPDGSIVEFANKDAGRLYRLCLHLDRLQSKVNQPEIRHKQRRRMKKALCRARQRITNLVNECHHKVAKYLCENYTTILLPLFQTSNMVPKIKRRIGRKTARMLLTWSHYRFRQTLLSKSREYPQAEVIIVDESYTSKTCGSCGELHKDLKKKEIFVCPHCGFTDGRDINAARNILLKFLTEHERAEEIRCWVLAPGESTLRATGSLADSK